jgi:3-deoxy-D-manno-octulosonic-acid transferase
MVADAAVYLPLDTKANAQQFMRLFIHSMNCFIKYEFWLNCNELKDNKYQPNWFLVYFMTPTVFQMVWCLYKIARCFYLFFVKTEKSKN